MKTKSKPTDCTAALSDWEHYSVVWSAQWNFRPEEVVLQNLWCMLDEEDY